MEYGRIISESFRISWRYKSLWVFGLFAGAGGSGFHFDDSWFEKQDLGFDLEEFFQTWDISFDWHLLIPIAVAFTIMGLAFTIMHLISVPALIDGINKIKRGGSYRLGSSFSVGIDFFWRFFGLSVIAVVVIFGAIITAVAFGFFAYAIHWAILVFYILLMIPLFFGFTFVAGSVFELATRAMVVRDIGVFDSIHEGYLLLRRNLGSNFLMCLIYVGLSMGLGLGALLIWAMVGGPIALIALATGLGILPAIILAVIMGLPISLIVGGFIGTVVESLYTLFYFELVEPGGLSKPASAASATPLA
jgi:hypothetical protein